jgi:hypothetical protein
VIPIGLDLARPLVTNAGMFGLWRPERFSAVVDLDTWEDEVADNASLAGKIAEGAFVPINVGGDGAFQFMVRGSAPGESLSDRERRFLIVSSEPYRLVSGGSVELGALEAVGPQADEQAVSIPLPAGGYSVVVHLVDWQAEPGMVTEDGDPATDALSDFVIEIFDELSAGSVYRTSVETFDRGD